jgi:sugar/nucleoside kinase (ribokinase family)
VSRLIHTGHAIVDIAVTVDALPPPGEDTPATGSAITAGGAVNTLVAAVRDGLAAVHVGARGTGPFADIVRAALSDAGVRAVGPVVGDVDTGFSIVMVDASAERTFVTSVGAEARLTRQDLDRVDARAGDTVVVTGYGLSDAAEALSGWVGALPAAVRVVLDPSPVVASVDRGALSAVLARADVVTANAREARLLVGGAEAGGGGLAGAVGLAGAGGLAGAAADASALAALLRPGAAAVVRDGARGCFLSVGDGVDHIPGFAVEAVDTTGAGDAHCGVLCAALSRGDTLARAVRRANAAAAIAVSRRGPATSPTSDEIDLFLAP